MNRLQVSKFSLPIVLLILLVFFSCESIFESFDSNFQTQEYEMESADQMAKESLSSYSMTINTNNIAPNTEKVDLFHSLNGIIVNDNFYTYDTTIFKYDTTVSTGGDSVFTPSVFTIDTLLTSYNVVTASDTTNSFLRLTNNKNGNLVFFFTDYVQMKMYSEENNQMVEIKFIDDTMPLETIAGYFAVSSDNNAKPIIKSRYVFPLKNKDYLMEIMTNDQTVSTTFKAAFHFE